MAGTVAGGLKAKEKNLARDPNWYANIGRKGGAISRGGGFATKCICDVLPEPHKLAQCAGTRGGFVSRRGPSKKGSTWNQNSTSSSSTTSRASTGRPSRKSGASQNESSETSGLRSDKSFIAWLFGGWR